MVIRVYILFILKRLRLHLVLSLGCLRLIRTLMMNGAFFRRLTKGFRELCGIAGFTHRNGCPDTERIRKAATTLIHRGPDQLGIFQSHSVSLGATRLRIIDLESGEQPFSTEDGDSVIVFNGEIFNHKELRAELESRGHRFRTTCDTETALYAFLEWNTECFSRLRGMFALAVWTESTRTLVLARDRIGIKPLYVARRERELFFGSELKAILVHPEIERRLSLAGLDCYLSLNYVPGPWTLVDGVEKLAPGTWLKWRDGEVWSDTYWKLPFGDPRPWKLDDAKEELDALLKQSVREQLASDVPVGVWLSGGIDSSTVLHYAATESGSPLKTFSISFRDRGLDESRYMHQMAERYGTDHTEFDLNSGPNLQDAIEEFAYYSDEPSADAGALPVWFLSKLSKTRTTVALSGEGADELLGGYLTYRADHLAKRSRRLPATALRAAKGFTRLWPVSDEKIGFEYKVKRFLEGSLLPPDRAHTYWNGTFSETQKDSMLTGRLPGALDGLLGQVRALSDSTDDDLAPYLWFDQKYFLPDDILVKTDRMSMAHALEVRPPFLDHRIVEFAATLPTSFKIRGSRQKVLLKELMKDKLPSSIVDRGKVGFDIPAHQWLRGGLRAMLVETVTAGASDHDGLFRPNVLQTYLNLHLERRANLGYHLWGLMILFLWMKKWGIQSAPEKSLERVFSESTVTLS
jgi:asparagine synthase (glutamine-hydrolysing)